MVVRRIELGLDESRPERKEASMEFGIFSQMHCPEWDEEHSRYPVCRGGLDDVASEVHGAPDPSGPA